MRTTSVSCDDSISNRNPVWENSIGGCVPEVGMSTSNSFFDQHQLTYDSVERDTK